MILGSLCCSMIGSVFPSLSVSVVSRASECASFITIDISRCHLPSPCSSTVRAVLLALSLSNRLPSIQVSTTHGQLLNAVCDARPRDAHSFSLTTVCRFRRARCPSALGSFPLTNASAAWIPYVPFALPAGCSSRCPRSCQISQIVRCVHPT